MIYVFEQGNIIYDESILTDEQKQQAVIVTDQLPVPEEKEGMLSVLKVDSVKKEIYYEYVEAPVPDVPEEGVLIPFEPQVPKATLEDIAEENLLETKYQTLLLEMML